MRMFPFIRLAIVIGAVSSGSSPAAGELVDRILAVVNDEIITLSDVRKAQLFEPSAPDGNTADGEQTTVQRLIEHHLLLAETKKFEVAEPTKTEVSEALKALKAQYPSEISWLEKLQSTGLTPEEAEAWVKERLWVEKLLGQRVTLFVLVLPQEVEAYYKEHTADYADIEPDQARARIQSLLEARKGREKLQQYIERLKSRARIQINPPSVPGG
jgi:peptidyl-prolyl cis-trans isomerase SurA